MNPLLKAVVPTDRLPHIWQVLATLLGVSSVVVLAWYLSQNGLLDLAATGIAFYTTTLLRQLGGGLSRRAPKEFAKTAGLLDTARVEFREWMSSRKLLTHVLIALVMTVAFLIGRFIASILLTVIASPWLALAAGLALAAAIASPQIVKGIGSALSNRSERSDPSETAADSLPPVPPMPAAVLADISPRATGAERRAAAEERNRLQTSDDPVRRASLVTESPTDTVNY